MVFCSASVFPSPSFFAFGKLPNHGKPIFSLKETADGSSHKDLPRLTVSSIKSDGDRRGRPPRKSSSSGKTTKPQSSDGESSNQEEIIALFRRIQSSISKEESVSTKERKSYPSQDKSSTDSVLEILRQSRKQVKDTTSNKQAHKVKVLSRRTGSPKKEPGIVVDLPEADFKLTRPPSNFVKRSPIPSASTPRGKEPATTSGSEELKLPRVEEMKLTELKELAKSRGIRGYSKLKKSELIELLK